MNSVLYFDTEWANPKNKSICQIGLVSENYTTKDPIYPERNIYVDPNDVFDRVCVSVHGITEDKVRGCDTFDKVWKEIEPYFVNSVVVGYNVVSADLDALAKNLSRYGIDIPPIYCLDLYRLAMDLIQPVEIENYKLCTLCEYFGIDFENDHDAMDDALVCSDLLSALTDNYSFDPDEYVTLFESRHKVAFSPYMPSTEFRRELAMLYGTMRGISCDRIINDGEREYLEKWRDEHKAYSQYREVSFILKTLDDILEDGVVTLTEAKLFTANLARYINSVKSSRETAATRELQGIVAGVAADSVINDTEIVFLQRWLYDNDYLSGHYPYDKLYNCIKDILEDGVITSGERKKLLDMMKKLFSPLDEILETTVIFEGHSFCLTGSFTIERSEVEARIEKLGGSIDKTVKKSTDYLVVGKNGSSLYSNGTYGTKIKKALEIGTVIIREEDLPL